MWDDPKPGRRYDVYEPERYRCVTVEDDWLNPIANELNMLDFYWHSLDVPGKGLAYYGITLIPPESLPAFLAAAGDDQAGLELRTLLSHAAQAHKFVIHFGV